MVKCLTVGMIFFFPAKFHTNLLTVFRQMVVSSEKITCSQFIVLFYLEPIFPVHFGTRNRFDKGRLYLAPASCNHHCIVVLSLIIAPVFLNLFSMSRTVMNVCFSTIETVCSSCLDVVPRPQPDRIESLQSFNCFHYCQDTSNYFCYSHMTKLWTH